MARLPWLAALLVGLSSLAAQPANLLKNPSFEAGFDATGLPTGWGRYAGGGDKLHLAPSPLAHEGKQGLLIDDNDPATELGVIQQVPAQGGLVYRAAVWVHGGPQRHSAGAFLQLRFLPSGEYKQVALMATVNQAWREIHVTGKAPAGTTGIQLYLYCHRDPIPQLVVDDASLVSGAEMEDIDVPDPVPPVISQLKDLHVQTAIVADGRPAATIIVPAGTRYRQAAERLQVAIRQLTGTVVPIADDGSPAAAVPLAGNLICLGNRSTNRTISQLYDRFYTLLDLKYPGPGGFEVRSLHSPFGDGRNVLFAGGSDDAGVEAAADALAARLKATGAGPGRLSVGWLQQVKLSPAYEVPKDLKAVQVWEASDGYGSSGYFGWNSISKRMALYYMTGDEHSAREVIRLAFPDEATKKELAETDGEMIENKDAPLSGPYHYNAIMTMLFWNLIEASPVFTDAERLKVTQAFATQLEHRKGEGIYPLTEPPFEVGSRHGQWSAMSLYVIARYFQTYYPNPIWKQALRASKLAFAPLYTSAFVDGESDNLYWYCTGTAPILTYMVMSGDRKPLESGSLGDLLRGQEALVSGQEGDWALRYAALDYLNKAAYLTGDGRWVTYRNRTHQDPNVFRLGQSFWPDEQHAPQLPADLAGRWNVHQLTAEHWSVRGNGLPLEQSFGFASFRSAPDASGDYVLLDGFNGASRNPYHCFAILQLRIGGRNVLYHTNGAYLNQVLTKADGMVEPKVAMDAALRYRDVLGGTAVAVGEVPKMSFANWRRTLAQRIGRYALVVDDLTFRADSENMEVKTLWQSASAWDPASQAVKVMASAPPDALPGWQSFGVGQAKLTSQPADVVDVDSYKIRVLRSREPGGWLEMAFTVPGPVEGELYAELVNYLDRGTVRFELDGQPVGQAYDSYAAAPVLARVPLGRRTLAAGEHRLRVTATQTHVGGSAYIGLRGLAVRPAGAPGPESQSLSFDIRSCDAEPATLGGDSAASFTWRGPARAGQHRVQFSLLAPSAHDPAQPVACLRLAENAAILALPEPALAVVGEYGQAKGDMVVTAADHLFALNATAAGTDRALLTANAPISADWDFATGKLELSAEAPVTLSLAAAPGVQLDGKPAGRVAGNLLTLDVPAGRHLLTGAKPTADLAAPFAAWLAQARQQRETALAALNPPKLTAPALAATWTADVAHPVTAVEPVGEGAARRLYVAEQKTVHVLDAAGKETGKLETDGTIRVLRWWPEANLLLVGCQNEQVVAFTPEGQRKWVFTSVMDPAVFRAAKQYWFKTAPGHEGIHGLTTGPFIDGKPQAMVGSACTLEVLNPDGTLARRLPVFWGPGVLMKVVDGPEGTHNLLIGRWPNDWCGLAVINSKTLNPDVRSFNEVPAGYDYVGGWCDQNRNHLFYTDLYGDGKKELVSEVNGTWNRVTIWDATGKALANVNFGPGQDAPVKTMRDLDLADLNGDGKPEIVAAVNDGLVVALDNQCKKVWATRLPVPAATLVAVKGAPRLLAACDDGSVLVLDGRGTAAALGKVEGRPVVSQAYEDGTVMVATEKGKVALFEP